MSIGAFPTTPAPRSVTIRSVAPTRVSVTHSGKRQVRSVAAQRWAVQATWSFQFRAQFMPLWAAIMKLRGQYENCTWIVPVYSQPQGSVGGTPLVVGAHAAGVRSISIDGCSAGSSGWLKAGDFLRFENHSKVYQVVADVTTDGSGAATLTIEPGLREALIDNEGVTVSDVPFTLALAADDAELPARQGLVVGETSFTFVEDV